MYRSRKTQTLIGVEQPCTFIGIGQPYIFIGLGQT
jgi:hypothetical protein